MTTQQPLSGIRVVDFSSLVPGPLATLILAEAGAEVIRVTRPDGDPMAELEPQIDRMNAEHTLLVAGKSVVAADLKDPDDKEQIKELIASADIVVDGFRPGVMEKLGLGYDALSAAQPGLIYCALTGYGQTVPNRSEPGHDLNYQAKAGILSLWPDGAHTPTTPTPMLGDIAGGSYPAVINILLALLQRNVTGKGAFIDIAIAENLGPFLVQAQARAQATGVPSRSNGEMLTGASPRYHLYPTHDGRLLAVAAIETKFWRNFCQVVGLDMSATVEDVRSVIAGMDAEYWLKAFAGRDACVSLVASLPEAIQPMLHARKTRLVQTPAGTKLAALPLPVADDFRPDPNAPRKSLCSKRGQAEEAPEILRHSQ